MSGELCGAPMRRRAKEKTCARPAGHNGHHRSADSVERRRAYFRQYDSTPEQGERKREHGREYHRKHQANDPEYRERRRENSREYGADPEHRFRKNLLRDIRTAKAQLEALENGNA